MSPEPCDCVRRSSSMCLIQTHSHFQANTWKYQREVALAREQTLQARAQNKTSAQMAAEIAQVHKLTTLLAERVDFLADLACSRHGFMDHVRARTSAKADKKGLKRRAGDDPSEAPLVTPSVPATSGVHTLPMEVDNAGRGATSASSSTQGRQWTLTPPLPKGPPRLMGL